MKYKIAIKGSMLNLCTNVFTVFNHSKWDKIERSREIGGAWSETGLNQLRNAKKIPFAKFELLDAAPKAGSHT